MLREVIVLLFGAAMGASASSAYLLPAHAAAERDLGAELQRQRQRWVWADLAHHQAEARALAANVEIDRLRRQLAREREVGQGRSDFAEDRPERIPPANVWVPDGPPKR